MSSSSLLPHTGIDLRYWPMWSLDCSWEVPVGPGSSGTRFLYENGYGISMIPESEPGLFEIAILKHDKMGNVRLEYSTPLTNDVIRNVTFHEAEKIANAVMNLGNLHYGCTAATNYGLDAAPADHDPGI